MKHTWFQNLGRTGIASTTSDMGAPYTIHDMSAFICFEHHGAEVKFGLRGMMARMVL